MKYIFKVCKTQKDLEKTFAVRKKVFIDEFLADPKYEIDNHDVMNDENIHVIVLDGEKPIGTTRLYIQDNEWFVGRVCLLKEYRGQNIGLQLLKYSEDILRKLKVKTISLDSRPYVIEFYEKLGYQKTGEVYEIKGREGNRYKMTKKIHDKVVLGISGGVDSAVSALLLKERGYDVEAVFMQNWDSLVAQDQTDPLKDETICQAEIDFQDAKKVCDQLGINITRVNFVKEYWDKVFAIFLKEYEKGNTPNPDILCNKEIKFKAFLDYANQKFKPDKIAMGHYAQISHDANFTYLTKACDEEKDQTYFLAQIDQNILNKLMFPIGHLTKSEVREIAKKNNLINAQKKDSTGICFIGERNFNDFLGQYLKDQQGQVRNIETSEVLGQHNGLFYHTIGQRKGLGKIGITATKGEPGYLVCQKDIKNNILYICQGENNQFLQSNEAIIEDINFLVDDFKPLTVKFRYRSEEVKCQLVYQENNKIKIKYDTAFAVCRGQQAVFYHEKICLGGGVIKEIFFDSEKR